MQYARERISDMIIGMNHVEVGDPKKALYFLPSFVDSPTVVIGPPFFIVFDRDGYRRSNEEEEDLVIEFLRKHY